MEILLECRLYVMWLRVTLFIANHQRPCSVFLWCLVRSFVMVLKYKQRRMWFFTYFVFYWVGTRLHLPIHPVLFLYVNFVDCWFQSWSALVGASSAWTKRQGYSMKTIFEKRNHFLSYMFRQEERGQTTRWKQSLKTVTTSWAICLDMEKEARVLDENHLKRVKWLL